MNKRLQLLGLVFGLAIVAFLLWPVETPVQATQPNPPATTVVVDEPDAADTCLNLVQAEDGSPDYVTGPCPE